MKLPQFKTATLLLAVAFTAVVFATIMSWDYLVAIKYGIPVSRLPWQIHLFNYAITSTYWVPIGFLGFAIGRKQLTITMVVALAIAQVIALLVQYASVAAMPY